MFSACCCTVSPTTSSTCFVCSYLRRCAPHRSKRFAFSCLRSGRASAKQLVASAFTWPADGLSGISSKSPATLLRLSRRFDNVSLARSKRSHFEKQFVSSNQRQNKLLCGSSTGRHPFLRHQSALCVTILASDELTGLGAIFLAFCGLK